VSISDALWRADQDADVENQHVAEVQAGPCTLANLPEIRWFNRTTTDLPPYLIQPGALLAKRSIVRSGLTTNPFNIFTGFA